MIGHCRPRVCGLVLITALAIALASGVVQAQELKYTMAACITGQGWSPPQALGDQPALNLNRLPANLRSIQTCANYCLSGSIPYGAEQSRSQVAFSPPYRYATINNGRWCYCGREVQGETVAPGKCAGKMNCLYNLESECYVNTEFDHMVVDLMPPAGATTVTGGGGGGPDPGSGTPGTGLPPFTANRRPNPPTVQPGGWEPPFPLQYEGAYQMAWRNNGDPDGDVLTFGVIIWQYDWAGRRWMQVPTLRDQYGTYGMVWLPEDNYTFTVQNGLSPQTHYAWMVFACDLEKGPATLCSWSGWSLFRTQ